MICMLHCSIVLSWEFKAGSSVLATECKGIQILTTGYFNRLLRHPVQAKHIASRSSEEWEEQEKCCSGYKSTT